MTTYRTRRQRGARVVGGRYTVPATFVLEVDDPEVPFLVELDVDNRSGAAQCRTLRCIARAEGPPITSDGLRRVRLPAYLRDAGSIVIGSFAGEADGFIASEGPLEDDEFSEYLRERQREERRGRRRITDEDLERVASVYRLALVAGRSPTAAVEEELRLRTRAQAARWVSKARDAGFLRAAPGPRMEGEVDA